MFGDSDLNLHLDIGCAAGDFLFDLALVNTSWNYLGIEIREKLVNNAKLKVLEKEIKNLYFVFGKSGKHLYKGRRIIPKKSAAKQGVSGPVLPTDPEGTHSPQICGEHAPHRLGEREFPTVLWGARSI